MSSTHAAKSYTELHNTLSSHPNTSTQTWPCWFSLFLYPLFPGCNSYGKTLIRPAAKLDRLEVDAPHHQVGQPYGHGPEDAGAEEDAEAVNLTGVATGPPDGGGDSAAAQRPQQRAVDQVQAEADAAEVLGEWPREDGLEVRGAVDGEQQPHGGEREPEVVRQAAVLARDEGPEGGVAGRLQQAAAHLGHGEDIERDDERCGPEGLAERGVVGERPCGSGGGGEGVEEDGVGVGVGLFG